MTRPLLSSSWEVSYGSQRHTPRRTALWDLRIGQAILRFGGAKICLSWVKAAKAPATLYASMETNVRRNQVQKVMKHHETAPTSRTPWRVPGFQAIAGCNLSKRGNPEGLSWEVWLHMARLLVFGGTPLGRRCEHSQMFRRCLFHRCPKYDVIIYKTAQNISSLLLYSGFLLLVAMASNLIAMAST